MSFILDALKKSESDRQRQSGPALFEVKIAPPRSRLPIWAVAVAALLGVNAVIGAWLLLRHPSATERTSTAVASGPVSAAAVPQSAAADQVPAPAAPVAPRPTAPPASAGMPAPPVVAAASAPAPASNPAMNAGGGGEPTLAASERASQPGVSQDPTASADDYAPAQEPSPGQGLANHVKVGTSSGYILYQNAAVVPGANIPALRLDLHVYAPKPEDRFALVNMHKVREGDTLPEGVRVEAIIPDGVVLSHNGMKFLLPRQ